MDSLNENKLIARAIYHQTAKRASQVGEMEQGINIYTNPEIKQQFQKILTGQDMLTSNQKEKMFELVDSNFIIPCYVQEEFYMKLLKFLFLSKSNYSHYKNIMGFYSLKEKRIFMLVKNIQNVAYWSKNVSVSSVLIHEFQHCFLNLFPNSFVALHRRIFDAYYSRFCSLFFGVPESTKTARLMYHHLIKNFDTSDGTFDMPSFEAYDEIIRSIAKKEQDADDFLDAMFTYLKNAPQYAHDVTRKIDPSYKMYKDLALSYSAIGLPVRMIGSLCIQETIFSGEVICIESEFNTKPRHLALLDKIKVNRK